MYLKLQLLPANPRVVQLLLAAATAVYRQMQRDFTAGDKHIASADDVAVVLRAIQLPAAQLLQPGTLTLVVSKTRHRTSTSMYSLTFCVRVISPERHHWKPAVQAAAVMLRTPAVTCWSLISNARTPRVN